MRGDNAPHIFPQRVPLLYTLVSDAQEYTTRRRTRLVGTSSVYLARSGGADGYRMWLGGGDYIPPRCYATRHRHAPTQPNTNPRPRSSRARSMQISAESAQCLEPRARAGNSCTTITAARRVCRAALCISGRAYYPVWARCAPRVPFIVSVERTSVVRSFVTSPSALGR